MKARYFVTSALSFLLAALVPTQGFGQAKAKSVPKDAASRLVVMRAGDLKWVELDPRGAPGVMIADVWGDHAKGAFGAFIKFPAGFAGDTHPGAGRKARVSPRAGFLPHAAGRGL
jgi:hypothetical protein